MTVQDTSNKVEYIGDDVTLGPFVFTYQTLESWIQVFVDGIIVSDTTYTLDINADQETSPGGSVTFDTAVADQSTIVILRTAPLTQESDYNPFDAFPSERVEDDFDKSVIIDQQQQEVLDRAIVLPVDSTQETILPSTVALGYWRWNASGSAVEYAGVPGVIIPSEAVGTVTDMLTNANPVSGDIVFPAGYNSSGDGGGSQFLTRPQTGGPYDGGSLIRSVGDPDFEFLNLFPLGVVNVKQFGAVGDGVTDDTAKFTAAGSFSPTPIITPGIYRLDSNPAPTQNLTWSIDKGVTFTGTGMIDYISGTKIISRGDYRGIESDPTYHSGIFGYLEQNAAESVYSNIGYHGSAKTSYRTVFVTGSADIGVSAFATNDNINSLGGAWAFYGTAVREANVMASTFGMELDIANMGDTVKIFPGNPFSPGQNHALWIGSGGEIAATAEQPGTASVAIGIISNDPSQIANFDKGILFHKLSIDGTDGATGSGVAIAFSTGHLINWFNNSNTKVGEIRCTNRNATNGQRLDFSEFGMSVEDIDDGSTQFQVENIPAAANNISARAAVASSPPALRVIGSDTNIDLELDPKGSGVVKFGYNSSNATTPANFSADRFLEVKDASGTSYYLPLATAPW